MSTATRREAVVIAVGIVMTGLAVLLILPPLRPATEGAEPAAAARTGGGSLTAGGDGGDSDLQLRSLCEAYADRIDTVLTIDGDAVFEIGARRIHFCGGRLLDPVHLPQAHRYDPVFYVYQLEPLTELPPYAPRPVRVSADFLDALFGRTEGVRRTHGLSTTFLDHSVFINRICADALARIETDIRAAAGSDPAVRRWLDELDIVYSFQTRSISDTGIRSYHAYGLALDLEPRSYGRKQVFWEWTRVWYRQWHRVPLDQRWSPPQPVIETFERHGFVWGGKWTHFDTIHFEYRPEIILYNRLLAERDAPIYR